LSLQVTRYPLKFASDDRRVITRLFTPDGEPRVRAVADRVLTLHDDEADALLQQVLLGFGDWHRDIRSIFQENYRLIAHLIEADGEWSETRKLLLGAYHTMEYAIESAALFNPSIVPHPDQSGLPSGSTRFIMSLRATGEGHISSICFRTGVIDRDLNYHFDPVGRVLHRAKQKEDRLYENRLFTLKLMEMNVDMAEAGSILGDLGDHFTFAELNHVITQKWPDQADNPGFQHTVNAILWLARSNYQLILPADCSVSDIVIFPNSDNESNGIEDLRLVRFVDDDGTVTYYGTYTAFNGTHILPQLLETNQFATIGIHTLNGQFVQNKGMALFPRRVHGQYMMLARIDGENHFLMRSDNPYFWNVAQVLQRPQYSWEFVQVGNCGSPIETPEGWLVLTHGVGPMRQYCIGAMLLDLEDPSRVIGNLREPLLVPNEEEREGYVPNVVYSCGSMVHQGHLIMPYAMSDTATSVATVALADLLNALTCRPTKQPSIERVLASGDCI